MGLVCYSYGVLMVDSVGNVLVVWFNGFVGISLMFGVIGISKLMVNYVLLMMLINLVGGIDG